MEKSKKIKHSAICPDCNGNGYVQCHIEEGREHIVLQCQTCESEGEIYVDESMIWVGLMMVLLTACTRDLSPNPWTTVVRTLVKHGSQ